MDININFFYFLLVPWIWFQAVA